MGVYSFLQIKGRSRVNLYAVLHNLIVQVIAGGAARATNSSNKFVLSYFLAFTDQCFGQVPIKTFEAEAMPNNNVGAVALF